MSAQQLLDFAMQSDGRSAEPLKGLLISDGRPGNYHLAEGLVAAIERLRPVEVTRLEISQRRWTPTRFLAFLSNRGVRPEVVLRLGYGLTPDAVSGADFVASGGGDTLGANVAFSRLFDAPNYFYGSGKHYDVNNFDLVFTSHAKVATHSRHVRTMKPSPIDPDSMIQPALSQSQPPALIGILIGGNTSSITFSESDLTRLVSFMRDMHAATGTTFYVSNSRRTPQKLSDALVRLAEENDSAIHQYIDVRSAGNGTLRALYAASSAILCTADSSSMVSESVWLRRPTIAITPSVFSLDASELEYRGFLESNGWLHTMRIADLAPDEVLAKLRSIRPLVENGLDLLADVFRQRQPRLLAPTRAAEGLRVKA
jgi:mitochondrial fission protein ELM1